MNYSIISVNDKRKENIENIEKTLNKKQHQTRSFNGNNEFDVSVFKSLYSDLDIDSYALQPIVPVSRDRRPGEIGCWMSHYHRWNYIIKNNIDSMLIIEDDCCIDEDFLNRVNPIIEGMDFVLLGNWTEAVYVTNKAANLLIELSKEGIKRGPIDEFLMFLVRITGMRLSGWKVPVCGKLPITRQLLEKYESQIQHGV